MASGNAILSSPSSSTYLSFVFLLLITAILTSTVPQHTTSANYLYTYCDNNVIFQSNSSRLDRDALLSILVATNNESVWGYRNATVGNSLPINGLSLCRGDVSESSCFTCVSTAASTFPKKCPNGIQGLIWYDKCLIRYSPSSLGRLDNTSVLYMFNNQSVGVNLTQFNKIVKSTSYDVAVEAAKGGELRKFATKEAAYNDLQSIYVLGQCTPELSQTDCETCLKECVRRFSTCCSGKQGGRVIIGSCYIRYETFLFYNPSWVRTPVPVPAPAPMGNRTGAASSGEGKSSSSKVIIVIIPVAGAATLVMLIGIACFVMARRKRKKITTYKAVNDNIASNDFLTAESLQYDFSTLQVVTDNFSDDNKIGEGGFGGVYKGTLPDGQEVAVKRLSRSSLQGVQEFKNEMVLVAKLQQRNLVRVLGFCLEGEEKLLVYKFVPNKSLDYFLFDPERQGELDWIQRYKIILGIARGMLYLHEDSRLRIIHRDLKASNVLLDLDMDPKISDFGMARIFGGEQTQGMTSRVVGTHGYMAPEYMLEGQYSIKSDVYSFGVLVLEIISGRKNSSFYRTGWAEDLLTYAWNLWLEGRPYDFMNITMKDSLYPKDEVKRCIQIGLLCVQKDPEIRPTMAMVVHMLNMSSFSKLPLPQRPGFFVGGCSGKQPEQQVGGYGQSGYSSFPSSSTANDATISEVDPR